MQKRILTRNGQYNSWQTLVFAMVAISIATAYLLTSGLVAAAQTSATYRPHADAVYVKLDPKRPTDPSSLHVTYGVVDNFAYNKVPAVMDLAVNQGGTVQHYFLSSTSTLNGQPLSCGSTAIVAGTRLCTTIPSLAPGTQVALLWWSPGYFNFANDRATDEIVILAAHH